MDEHFPIALLDESEFPKKLLRIPQPPKKLYIRGKLPDFSEKKILTVIGSRRHTNYGGDVCALLIKSLATYPVAIVSGLAMGIDGIAHKAALDAGLTAVAFPGSGLGARVITPREHFLLAQRILESGGCMLSEFDPDFTGAIWSFPQRNRLMAGIADAVLVVEAENKSGTRITAKLATEYNIDVLAVPGPITSPMSDGTNQLIREGAIPITKKEDLAEALGFAALESGAATRYDTCSPSERRVLDLIASPMPRSAVIRALGMPTHETQVLLSAMEIKGLIKETLGELRRVC